MIKPGRERLEARPPGRHRQQGRAQERGPVAVSVDHPTRLIWSGRSSLSCVSGQASHPSMTSDGMSRAPERSRFVSCLSVLTKMYPLLGKRSNRLSLVASRGEGGLAKGSCVDYTPNKRFSPYRMDRYTLPLDVDVSVPRTGRTRPKGLSYVQRDSSHKSPEFSSLTSWLTILTLCSVKAHGIVICGI